MKLKLLLSLLLMVGTAEAQIVPQGQLIQSTATIAISTTTSAAISSGGSSLVGCQLPATFTGTTLTFTVATSLGGTYQPLYNSSGLVSYTVAAGQFIAIKPEDFYGVLFFKIVSGSSEAAARTLICSMKGI